MSVLGNIAHRLKTDIGENLRAQIDVGYSRQLTEARFNEQAQENKYAREKEIRDQINNQENAREASKQKLALQIAAGNKLYERASETGEWGGFFNYLENPGLQPMVRDYVTGLAEADGTTSLEAKKFDHQVKKDFEKKTLEEKKFIFEKEKFETQEERLQAKLFLDQMTHDMKIMQDLREQNERRNNRNDMIRFIDQTPYIGTEVEREGFKLRLQDADASPEAVTQVWDQIMKRYNDRLLDAEKLHRAKVAASGERGAMPTAPAPSEVALSADYLRSKMPDEFKALSDSEKDDQRGAMSRSLAFKAKQLARNARSDDMQEFLPEAFEDVKRGLKYDPDGGWFWFDKGEFNVSNVPQSADDLQALADRGEFPPGVDEESIALTMQERGVSRDQLRVILWRKQGIDTE